MSLSSPPPGIAASLLRTSPSAGCVRAQSARTVQSLVYFPLKAASGAPVLISVSPVPSRCRSNRVCAEWIHECVRGDRLSSAEPSGFSSLWMPESLPVAPSTIYRQSLRFRAHGVTLLLSECLSKLKSPALEFHRLRSESSRHLFPAVCPVTNASLPPPSSDSKEDSCSEKRWSHDGHCSRQGSANIISVLFYRLGKVYISLFVSRWGNGGGDHSQVGAQMTAGG